MAAWRRLSATLAMFGLSVLAACGVEYPMPGDGSDGTATGQVTGTNGMGRDTSSPSRPDPY